MLKDKTYVEAVGKVLAALPGAKFKIELDNGYKLICYISGKIRKNMINILPGDTVKIAISVVDPSKGRILYREKR